MKKAYQTSRRAPSPLLVHLKIALRENGWVEFKPLFLVVMKTLREAKAAHGGEDMLRLRMYNELQTLVLHGLAERSGKLYRGNVAALAASEVPIEAHLAAAPVPPVPMRPMTPVILPPPVEMVKLVEPLPTVPCRKLLKAVRAGGQPSRS